MPQDSSRFSSPSTSWETNMQQKQSLSVAAAATMIFQGTSGQMDQDDAFHYGIGNATLFRALKVIQVAHVSLTFKTYADDDAKMRDSLNNGGLENTCTGCNQTGCFCPDLVPPLEPLARLCEHCRCQPGGGLRCYCEPQRWDQEPMLARLGVPTVVYDYRIVIINRGARITHITHTLTQARRL